jgi:hypothetical protein
MPPTSATGGETKPLPAISRPSRKRMRGSGCSLVVRETDAGRSSAATLMFVHLEFYFRSRRMATSKKKL